MPLILVLILFLTGIGCSRSENKYIAPHGQNCEQQVIENEYIIMSKDGSFKKIKTTSRFEVPQDDALWFEPNYRISVPARNVLPTLKVSNEEVWKDLGIESLWAAGYRGQGVVVAVIDTGVEITSSYLDDRWHYNQVEKAAGEAGIGIDDDGNGYVDDILGWNFSNSSSKNSDEWNHGTQMAHIIAGGETSPIGPGVAPESIILPIDFMNEEGGDEVSAVNAINYAIERGAKVINNSWVTSCSHLLRSQLEEYSGNNVLIVNAAGNQAKFLSDDLQFSSNVRGKNLVNVGSITPFGQRSSFSNYGEEIILHTIGEGILTFSGIMMKESSGTSFSAAIVSGAAALLWSKYPDYTAMQIKNELYALSEIVPEENLLILRLH